MAEVPKNLESSLPVPFVQELQGLEKVPSRYVRDESIDGATAFPVADQALRVPLIDLTKLVNPEFRDLELQKLHFACKDWGLFQLINHGIPDDVVKNMGKHGKEFFDLPLQEKRRWAQKPGSLEGYGHAFVTSEEQKLDWNDMLFLRVFPVNNRKLDVWPQNPTQFREALETYTEGIRELAVALIEYMAMGLGVQAEELSKAYQEAGYEARLNYYPSCPESEKVIGFRPHADINGITFLLDCGQLPGLQVLKDSQWVFVEPMESAIVVNLGQATEIMSNGIYKAPDHRAVVNKLKERLSLAIFVFPNMKIGPAKDLIGTESRPKYKTVTLEEYLDIFFNLENIDVPFIDSLKI